MPTASDYSAKRDGYMHKARIVRCQIVMLNPKHRPNLRRLVSNYAKLARAMNHRALIEARIEHEREFRQRMRRP